MSEFIDHLEKNNKKLFLLLGRALLLGDVSEEVDKFNNSLGLSNNKIDSPKLKGILSEVISERVRQNEKWGQQNHPILDPVLIERGPVRMCEEYEIPGEERARYLCETHAKRGDLTYMHILIEEISEAASCGSNVKELRKELLQSAAVLVAMIESLDRNGC